MRWPCMSRVQEEVACVGVRPKVRDRDELLCAGERRKGASRDEAKCAGKGRKLRGEEVRCRGELDEVGHLADKENVAVAGEKSGAAWLVDQLAKTALEAGGTHAVHATRTAHGARSLAQRMQSDGAASPLSLTSLPHFSLSCAQRIWRR
jgi:hypothetical protein